jgi:hypothetical protein
LRLYLKWINPPLVSFSKACPDFSGNLVGH